MKTKFFFIILLSVFFTGCNKVAEVKIEKTGSLPYSPNREVEIKKEQDLYPLDARSFGFDMRIKKINYMRPNVGC